MLIVDQQRLAWVSIDFQDLPLSAYQHRESGLLSRVSDELRVDVALMQPFEKRAG